jgi:nitrite reductase (NADH) small subunit
MSEWQKVCSTENILENGGSCVKVDGQHIAIFNFEDKTQWYAIENTCPHQNQSVLSRGLTGEENGEPKVACPMHKRTFSLKSGKQLGEQSEYEVKTFPIKVEGNDIYLQLT